MHAMFLQLLLSLFFLTVILLHITQKHPRIIVLYAVQSCVVVALLADAFLATRDVSVLVIALLSVVVKVVVTPIFFFRLVRRYGLRFSASSYVGTPLTLVAVAALTAVAHAPVFLPLTNIIPSHQAFLAIALSAMFISLFLIVNSKGALSQIIGILSLENAIVLFALFAGLEQSFGLEMGIAFDIFVWVIIASLFVSMLYKHFGSLDVTSMRHLTD